MHKALRDTFSLVQTLDEQPAEDLHDRAGIERSKAQKLTIGRENSIGNQGMGTRIEVGSVAAEGLQRDDAAGADATTVKECLEGIQNRGGA